MPASKSAPAAASHAAGPQCVPANRRTRTRLRDLCDEVLASFRVARERDLFTDVDRRDARALLARVTPASRR